MEILLFRPSKRAYTYVWQSVCVCVHRVPIAKTVHSEFRLLCASFMRVEYVRDVHQIVHNSGGVLDTHFIGFQSRDMKNGKQRSIVALVRLYRRLCDS